MHNHSVTIIVILIQLPATQPVKFHPLILYMQWLRLKQSMPPRNRSVLVQITEINISRINQNISCLHQKATWVAGALMQQ